MLEQRIDQGGRSVRAGAAGLIAALVVTLVAGCAAVGPDYRGAPSMLQGSAFINAGASASNAQPVHDDIATFWRGFNDAELSALVERGMAANGDVRIAQARLQEARRAQRRGGRATRAHALRRGRHRFPGRARR